MRSEQKPSSGADIYLDKVREAHALSITRNVDVVITKDMHVRIANPMSRRHALEIFRAPRPYEEEVAA